MPNLSELLYYNGEIPLTLIVWSIFIGVVVAVISGYIIKSKLGSLVRNLLDKGIDSPEKAVSLSDLGLQKSFFIKLALKSPINFTNLLVAITEDGRFYSNNTYTNEPPSFKEFSVIHKTKKGTAAAPAEKDGELKEEIADVTIECNELSDTEKTEFKKERVKFDVLTAKYYIPKQVYSRAFSLYSEKPTRLLPTIALLVILALVAVFAGKLVSGFTGMISGIADKFSPPKI
jgi:hypothetical protein